MVEGEIGCSDIFDLSGLIIELGQASLIVELGEKVASHRGDIARIEASSR